MSDGWRKYQYSVSARQLATNMCAAILCTKRQQQSRDFPLVLFGLLTNCVSEASSATTSAACVSVTVALTYDGADSSADIASSTRTSC